MSAAGGNRVEEGCHIWQCVAPRHRVRGSSYEADPWLRDLRKFSLRWWLSQNKHYYIVTNRWKGGAYVTRCSLIAIQAVHVPQGRAPMVNIKHHRHLVFLPPVSTLLYNNNCFDPSAAVGLDIRRAFTAGYRWPLLAAQFSGAFVTKQFMESGPE